MSIHKEATTLFISKDLDTSQIIFVVYPLLYIGITKQNFISFSETKCRSDTSDIAF